MAVLDTKYKNRKAYNHYASKSSCATWDNPAPATARIPKRLTEAVRVVAALIQRSVPSTKKAVAESGRTLSRSFSDLVLRHNVALGCSSHDVSSSFVSPRDYEFSCTSSPPRRRRPPPRHRRRFTSVAAIPLVAVADDSEFHVDRAADEFIDRFYRELMMQKLSAARDASDRFA